MSWVVGQVCVGMQSVNVKAGSGYNADLNCDAGWIEERAWHEKAELELEERGQACWKKFWEVS